MKLMELQVLVKSASLVDFIVSYYQHPQFIINRLISNIHLKNWEERDQRKEGRMYSTFKGGERTNGNNHRLHGVSTSMTAAARATTGGTATEDRHANGWERNTLSVTKLHHHHEDQSKRERGEQRDDVMTTNMGRGGRNRGTSTLARARGGVIRVRFRV